jgi:hypothetical protein
MHKCNKTRVSQLQMSQKMFFQDMILVVSKYAQMHQNTCFTTPDVKIFFS